MSANYFLTLFAGFIANIGRTTKFFALLVGQSCRSALNSGAAQQRRPTGEPKKSVLHP
jgi:hypothetical protein